MKYEKEGRKELPVGKKVTLLPGGHAGRTQLD
jgi:hypothetical protein